MSRSQRSSNDAATSLSATRTRRNSKRKRMTTHHKNVVLCGSFILFAAVWMLNAVYVLHTEIETEAFEADLTDLTDLTIPVKKEKQRRPTAIKLTSRKSIIECCCVAHIHLRVSHYFEFSF